MAKRIDFLLVLVFCGALSASTNYLMSNEDFTNVGMYPVEQYIQCWEGEYTEYDIHYAWEVFAENGLNPLLFFLIAQKEGMPRNWIMGCGKHLNLPGYEGFEQQVWCCVNTLRGHYDTAVNYKYHVRIYDRNFPNNVITVNNRATYALYLYTPHYKQYIYGDWHGNWCVPAIWQYLKGRMDHAVKKTAETNK